MRRILIVLVIVALAVAALAALWIFRGREISLFIDRYWTLETQSAPIQSVAYEGTGTGGMFICNGVSFSLNDITQGLSLSVGSTKDNQLALASVSLLRRLRAIRRSSSRVTVFSVGRYRSR
jgi:hypothetical protein